jgi:hypothetical protein
MVSKSSRNERTSRVTNVETLESIARPRRGRLFDIPEVYAVAPSERHQEIVVMLRTFGDDDELALPALSGNAPDGHMRVIAFGEVVMASVCGPQPPEVAIGRLRSNGRDERDAQVAGIDPKHAGPLTVEDGEDKGDTAAAIGHAVGVPSVRKGQFSRRPRTIRAMRVGAGDGGVEQPRLRHEVERVETVDADSLSRLGG